MRRTPRRLKNLGSSPFVVGAVLFWMTLGGIGGAARAAEPSAKAQLSFGVRMAQQGLWQEALFRFHQAETLDAKNPRILNNLAVAYEATGEFDRALDYYKQALAAAPDNRETRRNYVRFVEFYQAYKGKPKEAAKDKAAQDKKDDKSAAEAPPNEAVPAAPPPPTFGE